MKYLVLFLCAFPLLVNAASFDCSKAKTNIEKLVCSNPELSELDSNLGQSYEEIKKTSYGVALKNIKKGQTDWISETRNKCQTEKCLIQSYLDRNFALNSMKVRRETDSDCTSTESKDTYIECMSILEEEILQKIKALLSDHVKWNTTTESEEDGIYVGRSKAIRELAEKSQLEWEKYRDTYCDGMVMAEFTGGTGAGIEATRCRIFLSKQRLTAIINTP